MTQLTDQERNAQMDDMRSFDGQMPCVGYFWYDPVDHSFFGVRKKEITPQVVEEAAEKGRPFISYSEMQGELRADGSRLSGSVIWSIDKFIVLVGKWAEPIQEELTELLEKEFSLPYIEFVYVKHWDLDHGWSEDMPRWFGLEALWEIVDYGRSYHR